MTRDVDERLQAEAAFQDARAGQEELEARDYFYYLTTAAFKDLEKDIYAMRGQRIVVVGCSDCGVIPMAKLGNHVIGIDVSSAAIEMLSQVIDESGLSHRAEALVMNAEDLDFQESSIDAIVCTGVLHHLDIPKAIASWSRVLKPTGKVYMLEPMAYHPVIAIYRWLTPAMRTRDEHPLVAKDICLLRQQFEAVHIDSYAMTTLASLPFAYSKTLHGVRDVVKTFFTPIDRVLWSIFPPLRYFAWTWYVCCERPKK